MLLPVFLIIIGAYFLLSNLGYLPPETWGVIWPLFVIAVGLSMVFGRKKGSSWCCWPWEKEGKKKSEEK